jgi:hypothetical protein
LSRRERERVRSAWVARRVVRWAVREDSRAWRDARAVRISEEVVAFRRAVEGSEGVLEEGGGGFVVVVVVVVVMVGGFDGVLLLLTAGIFAAVVRAAPLGRADIGIAVKETAAHCCWVRREGRGLAISRWVLFDERAFVVRCSLDEWSGITRITRYFHSAR